MTPFGIVKIAIIGFIFSYIFSSLFFKKGPKLGKKEKTTFGGVVISSSIFIGLLLSPLRMQFLSWRIFLPFIGMFLLGFWDDYREFPPYLKLVLQIFVISFTLFLGFRTEIIYFPKYINYLISLGWMLIITNAFNFLDIMDGLCVGSLLAVSLGLSIIGFINFQPLNLLFSLLIFASVLGFLPFNYKKAHAYLGDSGSLSLGFLISVLTISFSYAREDNPIALFTPLVILGLPLFDFIYVTLRRMLQGKSILKKSPDHLALLMEKKGIPKDKVVQKFWGLSLIFVFSALVLQFGPLWMAISALIISILILVKIAFRYYR